MSNTYFNISDKLRLYEFDGLLDQYGDAAAAYSLRKLRSGYTGSAIRVRRSSDNTERDMGFWNNELDTIALLDWVNEEYVTYESNFAAGGDGYSVLQMVQTFSESIAGENDATKFELISGDGNHYAYYGSGSIKIGQTMKVTGRYYIPSTNVSCNAIRISGGSSEFVFANTLDEWAEFEHITTATVSYAIFRAANGTNTTLDGDDDVFYLKDVVYTQTTADGLVHTWYDQSANANHAVQGTATAQPKIVDAGALVTTDSKPSLKFDGVDDFYQINRSYTQPYTLATVFKYNLLQPFDFVLSGSATHALGSDGSGNHRIYAGVNLLSGTTDLTQKSHFAMYNGATSQYSVNGNNVTGDAGTGNTFQFLIGKRGGGAGAPLANANISEVLVYDTDESSIRTDVETNINNYYSIY
jgi:hypothetical protein